MDIYLWVEDYNILNLFYAKPLTSPYVIKFASALSPKTKRSFLLQEGLRRLQDMGPGVPEVEKNKVMSRFMTSLNMSGYDQKYGLKLLKGILNRQMDIDREVAQGQRSEFRSRAQILQQKAERLIKHKNC